MEESFMVISTANLNEYKNTRVRFTNKLAKTANTRSPSVNSLYLSIDQINFEFNPSYYVGHKGVPDIITYYENISIAEQENTLDELLIRLHRDDFHFYKIWQNDVTKDAAIVRFDNYLDEVKIHKRLWEFLKFPPIRRIIGDYYIVKQNEVYKSVTPVSMNIHPYNFAELVCFDIEPYYFNGGFTQTVARIDLRKKIGNTIHLDIPEKRYFKLNSTRISELSFELRHGNGDRLLLFSGAPTIIKATMKEMSSLKDFFYVQMDSTPNENFKENTSSAFTIALPREYKLEGTWRVAVSHAEIPTIGELFDQSKKLYSDVENDNIYFILNEYDISNQTFYYNTEVAFPRRAFTKEFIATFLQKSFPYITVMIDEYENILFYGNNPDKSYTMAMSKQLYDVIIRDPSGVGMKTIDPGDFMRGKINYEYIGEEFLKTCGKKFKEVKMIEFVAKENSVLPRKGIFNFTVDEYYNNEEAVKEKKRGQKIHSASENWEIKGKKSPQEEKVLLNIAKTTYNLNYQEPQIPTWLFMYADFVKPSITADTYSNVLKLIPYKQKQREDNGMFYTFNPLDWFTVNTDVLNTLRIELRMHDGNIFNCRRPYDKTYITLLFERVY